MQVQVTESAAYEATAARDVVKTVREKCEVGRFLFMQNLLRLGFCLCLR